MAITSECNLGQEQIHDVLSNERRRQTLEILKEEQTEVELRPLTERIAEIESGESPPPRGLRQSVYSSLHQTHLPKLDDLGIVDYDKDRKRISIRPEARRVDLYMEVLTPYGITWSSYYQALGILAVLTIVADQLDVLILSGDYPLVIAGFFLLIMTVSTAYQLWSTRFIHIRNRL